MHQFKLPAAHSVRISGGEGQGFTLSLLLGRAAIFGDEKDDGFQNSSRVSCHFGEEEVGREESTSKLHTSLEGEVIEEIRNFLK